MGFLTRLSCGALKLGPVVWTGVASLLMMTLMIVLCYLWISWQLIELVSVWLF